MKTSYLVTVRWLLLVAMIFQALSLSAQWTTASLSQARTKLAATSAEGKVFFAGGRSDLGGLSNVVDIFDTVTNTWSTANLSVGREGLVAASAGGKVLFAGSEAYSNVVDIYDIASNTWSTATLSQGRAYLAATSVGNLVFFAGGQIPGGQFTPGFSDVVDIYNTSTNTWSTATLSLARSRMAAGTLGSKVYFAGGNIISGSTIRVDIYDSNTGIWSTSAISVARGDMRAATAGNKLFMGTAGFASTQLDVFGTEVDYSSQAQLSVGRAFLAIAGTADRAYFAGGYTGSVVPSAVVEIFNTNLQAWSMATLSLARYGLVAASAGGMVFFAGGSTSGGFGDPTNRVDIYIEPGPPQPTVITQQPTPATQTVCQGGSASSTVAATGTNLAYAWYRNNPNTDTPVSGQTAATLSLSNVQHAAAGTYYCRISGDGGVVWSQAFTLSVNPTPVGSNGTPTTCPGVPLNVDLQALITNSVASNFTWFVVNSYSGSGAGSGSGDFITQTLNNPGNVNSVSYQVTPTSETGGCAGSAFSVNVTVNPLPNPSIMSGGPPTICAGGSVNLFTGVFSSYVWKKAGNPVGTDQNYLATTVGTYTVTVTNQYGCVRTSNPVTITENPAPVPVISAGSPTSFCTGGSVTLSTAPFSSTVWKKDNVQVSTDPTYTATTSGTYTVTVTNSNDCVGISAPVVVTVSPVPTPMISAAGATTFCTGGNVVLSVGNFDTYVWKKDGNPVSTDPTYTATTSGSYTVTVTAGGCSATSEPVAVTVTPGATASAITLGDNLVCQALPSQSSTVAVQATFGGAATSGSFSDGGIGGTFSLVTDGTLVAGNYYQPLNYTGPVTLTFSTNDPAGDCPAASSTASLTVQEAATASPITAGATAICQNATTTFSASWGGSATFGGFTDGGIGGTFAMLSQVGNGISVSYKPPLNFTGPITMYFVTTNPDGPCSYATTTTTLTVNSGATASAITLGDNGLVCQARPSQSSTVAVQATFGGAATSGSFSDGGIGGTFSLVTDGTLVAGNYYPPLNYTGPVTITFSTNDPTGDCPAASSTASLTVQEAATASPITAGATAICQNATTTFSASWGGSATFGGFTDGGIGGTFTTLSQVGNGISVSYKPPLNFTGPITMYFVTTNPDGPCSYATTTTTLMVNSTQMPTISATGPTSFCTGGSVVLSTGSFGSYLWKKDGNQVSTDPTYTATTSGSYTVTVTDGGSCSGTSGPVVIMVNPIPAPVILPGGPTSLCAGGSVTLSTGIFDSYVWKKDGNPVSTDPTYTATTGGSYTVTVTASGCTGTSAGTTVTATSLLFTAAATLPAGPFCAGQVVTLSFGANACLSGNSFRAQLSNASGDFSTPTATYPVTPGSNPIRLPLSADLGAGYILRVVASPSGLSSTTGAFAITGRPALGTPVVSGAPICAGQVLTLSLPVDCTLGFGQNNTFTPQLSDLNGNFSNPVDLDPVSPGINAVQIPATTSGGTGYRIRVLSSDPTLTSAVSNSFEVKVYSFNSTATVSRVPVCAGSTFTVSFTLTVNCPRQGGSAFAAELSDASGSFAAPVALGPIQQGSNPGVQIPPSTPAGSGYRVRVVVPGNPALTSSPSAPFQVRVPGFSSTPSVNGANKCPGEAVRLSFSAGSSGCEFFPGNGFTAQLSNASGNFSAPISLGAVASGISNVVIPVGTLAGTGYKIRVVSSSPLVMSTASADFKVKACGTSREIVPEEQGLRVSVSPNPSSEGRLRIVIAGAEGQVLGLELFNGTGRSLRQQRVERAAEAEVLDWDIARQPQGLYLLRVSGEKEIRTVKVLH